MVRNRYVALFIILVLVLFPMYAAENNNADNYDNFFTIQAFKNTPGGVNDNTVMSIYDVLSGKLNAVGSNPGESKVIDIDFYLGNFITDKAPGADLDQQHALFSYMVTGCEAGKYTLSINIPPFEGPYKETNGSYVLIGGRTYIPAYYKIAFTDTLFPSKHSKTSGSYTISEAVVSPKNYTSTSKVTPPATTPAADLTVTWTVSPEKAGVISDSWLSEGVVLMYMKNAEYTKSSVNAGLYKTNVTVTLTYGG